MTQDIIRDIFTYNLTSHQELIRGYIVVIDGKVFHDGIGKFIYPTRAAAVKGFYNSMKWKVSCYAHYHCPINLRDTAHRFYREPTLSEDEYNTLRDFVKFKKELIRNHNFQVIRLR